jgi:hypothetical protein
MAQVGHFAIVPPSAMYRNASSASTGAVSSLGKPQRASLQIMKEPVLTKPVKHVEQIY